MKGIACLVFAAALAAQAAPVKVIFDTDMGPDYDDVGALAMLNKLADQGEAEILGVLSCNRAPRTIACIEILNSFYGRPDIPVGCVPEGGPMRNDYAWGETLAKKYAKWVRHPAATEAPDAVAVFRRLLAAAPDKGVTVITVGFLSNTALLLKSKPDGISPLDGRALVEKKVKELVSMAAGFPKGREYNAMIDAAGSDYTFKNWPTPIIFSGFEIGENIKCGRKLTKLATDTNPAKDVFSICLTDKEPKGHSSWDETAILVGVRGLGEVFGIERGTIHMQPNGDNTWTADPNGPHARLTKKMEWDDVAAIIDGLLVLPPKK